MVGPEGMEKFCEDIGVEPENVSRFFVVWLHLYGVHVCLSVSASQTRQLSSSKIHDELLTNKRTDLNIVHTCMVIFQSVSFSVFCHLFTHKRVISH